MGIVSLMNFSNFLGNLSNSLDFSEFGGNLLVNLQNHDLDIIMSTKITSNFENNPNLLVNLKNHDLDIILFTKFTSNFENLAKQPQLCY